jgi:hypothetical protein
MAVVLSHEAERDGAGHLPLVEVLVLHGAGTLRASRRVGLRR